MIYSQLSIENKPYGQINDITWQSTDSDILYLRLSKIGMLLSKII